MGNSSKLFSLGGWELIEIETFIFPLLLNLSLHCELLTAYIGCETLLVQSRLLEMPNATPLFAFSEFLLP